MSSQLWFVLRENSSPALILSREATSSAHCSSVFALFSTVEVIQILSIIAGYHYKLGNWVRERVCVMEEEVCYSDCSVMYVD